MTPDMVCPSIFHFPLFSSSLIHAFFSSVLPNNDPPSYIQVLHMGCLRESLPLVKTRHALWLAHLWDLVGGFLLGPGPKFWAISFQVFQKRVGWIFGFFVGDSGGGFLSEHGFSKGLGSRYYPAMGWFLVAWTCKLPKWLFTWVVMDLEK